MKIKFQSEGSGSVSAQIGDIMVYGSNKTHVVKVLRKECLSRFRKALRDMEKLAKQVDYLDQIALRKEYFKTRL